jgi:hypothetical protein
MSYFDRHDGASAALKDEADTKSILALIEEARLLEEQGLGWEGEERLNALIERWSLESRFGGNLGEVLEAEGLTPARAALLLACSD